MEKRTAIIPRTNRRVALFNFKVNKKLTDKKEKADKEKRKRKEKEK